MRFGAIPGRGYHHCGALSAPYNYRSNLFMIFRYQGNDYYSAADLVRAIQYQMEREK